MPVVTVPAGGAFEDCCCGDSASSVTDIIDDSFSFPTSSPSSGDTSSGSDSGTSSGPVVSTSGSDTGSSGTSSGGTVQTECCESGMPNELFATITNIVGCICVDGESVALTWDPEYEPAMGVTGAWVFDGEIGTCSENFLIVLYCPGGELDFFLQWNLVDIAVDAGGSCSPVNFTVTNHTIFGGCNGGNVQASFHITA